MKKQFTVSLARIIKEFSLETVYMPSDAEEILIGNTEINRPGLQLSGYFEYYDNQRIQVLGRSEMSYLYELPEDQYLKAIDSFMATKPAAVIVSRNIEVKDEFLKAAETYAVPMLRTGDSTSGFLAALISFLNVQLAPRITRHGVLVEVFGEGILLLGESGVGKSETAIELVNRGHRLIADDAVEIRRVSSKSLVGTSPENIRHFIELRGIGIINASRIFGVGAVKPTEKIDLVINIEPWDSSKVYDRMGLEEETTEILGISLPSITVPVKPGRNLAVIIEVAARNNRQKKLGYNAAQALLERLGMSEGKGNQNDETGYSIF
ncbi:MAG: HPr(Ser) kinase/phosphatase [Clostridia bacterium]|nr:HPr(Ser) kinase/phosphatase [Clostridia bacterium]MBR3593761.1 HPr(Ser) kinase/phosphatase [Clostridia bacterium]